MNPQPRSRERAPALVRIGQCLEEVSTDNPEQIDVAGGRTIDHFRRPPAPAWLDRKPPHAAPSCRSHRIDDRQTPDFRAALNAGVSANCHQTAPATPGQTARK